MPTALPRLDGHHRAAKRVRRRCRPPQSGGGGLRKALGDLREAVAAFDAAPGVPDSIDAGVITFRERQTNREGGMSCRKGRSAESSRRLRSQTWRDVPHGRGRATAKESTSRNGSVVHAAGPVSWWFAQKNNHVLNRGVEGFGQHRAAPAIARLARNDKVLDIMRTVAEIGTR